MKKDTQKFDFRELRVDNKPQVLEINKISNNDLYTLRGETKKISEWANDPRCAVGLFTLKSRIKNGWSFDKSLLTPPTMEFIKPTKPQRKYYGIFNVFEKVKNSLRELSDSEECKVTFNTLKSRVYKYKWGLEEALTSESKILSKKNNSLTIEDIIQMKEISKNRKENETQKCIKEAAVFMGSARVIEINKDEDKILLCFRSRLGDGMIKWDSHVFPDASEKDEYKISIIRTKKGGRKDV